MEVIIDLFQDGFFAALAGVGFASISNPPRKAYPCCALLAAIGHSVRFWLMNNSLFHIHIVPASTLAALLIGLLAVRLSIMVKCPAETCFAPALLPMIPGMYAYRAVESLVLCLCHYEESAFNHYLYLLASNGFTCAFIVLGLVTGANIPVFLLKKISFKATRWSSVRGVWKS